MRRNKISMAIFVMTAILTSASLVPVRIRAEEKTSEGTANVNTSVPDDSFYTYGTTASDENGVSAGETEGKNDISTDKDEGLMEDDEPIINSSIYVNAHHGQVLVKVNGAEADQADAGDIVTLEFIPDRGYEFKQDVHFICKEQLEVKWNENICTFVMTECGNLGIYAEFVKMPMYSIDLMDGSELFSMKTTAGGVEVSSAGAGEEINIKASAIEGYHINGIHGLSQDMRDTLFWTREDEVSFTMPECDVKVYVLCSENEHNVTVDRSCAGHMNVRLLDERDREKTEFLYGDTVHAVMETSDSKFWGQLTAITASGKDVFAKYIDDEMYFTVPDEDVVITLTEGIQYVDEEGTKHIRTDCQTLLGVPDRIGVTISNGWYVVEGAGWGFNNRLTVTGDVNIILSDGCHLILNRGIRIYGGGSLSIWGGPAGNGRMDCVQAFETDEGKAGIGGDNGESGGIFNMYGGIVYSNGQDDAAGIGGGKSGHGGAISIYGGTLNVTGGENAAGIGGGKFANGGTIRISGGTVHAEGGRGTAGGAGIGGGKQNDGGDIQITGGTVNATGGNGLFGAGAGIGGGDEGNGGSISISGGSITATGARWGAGVGGGNCGNGGTINIAGGFLKAYGKNGGAGVGGGDEGSGGTININDGTVEAIGGDAAAGIGGGNGASGGTIHIRGGMISSIGTLSGAGIGGGEEGDGGFIGIYGGTVVARGGVSGIGEMLSNPKSGAGIGGGDDGNSGQIEIMGGDVSAKATLASNGSLLEDYVFAAGIGAGDDGDEESILLGGDGVIRAWGYEAVGCGEDGEHDSSMIRGNLQIFREIIQLDFSSVWEKHSGYRDNSQFIIFCKEKRETLSPFAHDRMWVR